MQTKQARLGNDLIAGTVGGFVGTALNTPYATFVIFRAPHATKLTRLAGLMSVGLV